MNAPEIRDIKPPLGFPANYLFLIIAAVAIALVLLFFLWKFWRKKRKKQRLGLAVGPPKPAHQLAYEQLQVLQAKQLPARGMLKQYYFELSDIVRHYIENRFEIRAPEMTTDEFLFALKDSLVLSAAHQGLLREFLVLCDIVKFAKYGPNPDEIAASFTLAVKLVDETRPAEEEKEQQAVK